MPTYCSILTYKAVLKWLKTTSDGGANGGVTSTN